MRKKNYRLNLKGKNYRIHLLFLQIGLLPILQYNGQFFGGKWINPSLSGVIACLYHAAILSPLPKNGMVPFGNEQLNGGWLKSLAGFAYISLPLICKKRLSNDK